MFICVYYNDTDEENVAYINIFYIQLVLIHIYNYKMKMLIVRNVQNNCDDLNNNLMEFISIRFRLTMSCVALCAFVLATPAVLRV